MTKFFILFTAVIFFLYGGIFIFFPHQAWLYVVQSGVDTNSASIDLRATYGGLNIGVGIILYVLARQNSTLKIGLLTVFLLMLSMAFGRMVGIVVDGEPNQAMYIYLALELLAGVVSLVLFKRFRFTLSRQ